MNGKCASSTVQGLKKALRKNIRNTLKEIPVTIIEERSIAVFDKITQQEFYKNANCISIFLSMPPPKEIQTWSFVKQCFKDGKSVYVPKVIGLNSDDMIMVPVDKVEDIQNWPLSNWKIPEPPSSYYNNNDNIKNGIGNIDLVIVPGLAFSIEKYRLGQGKGYYDTFFKKLYEARKTIDAPLLVGVALDEQIVDTVPVEEHDYILDYIVTPLKLV